jgi:putative Holliday junction resolvase
VRYLCIDLGDKRTGLAVGDDVTNLASPVGVLEVPRVQNDGRALIDAVVRAIEEHLGPRDEVVVGLPLHMDGTEGERAKIARGFAAQLGERAGRPIHLHDERLSSVQADWQMSQTGMTHKQKKKKRDALAAAAVLRDFLAT